MSARGVAPNLEQARRIGERMPLRQAPGERGLRRRQAEQCADHVMAWKVRHALNLDSVPMGPSPDHNDNMILDIQNGVSASGFGHPVCKGGNPGEDIIRNLSKNFPTAAKK